MRWQEDFKIRFHDTNSNEIVSASQIFKYLQETAMCQMRAQKPSYHELLSKNKALVLSNIRVELYHPIYAFENITVSSWACPGRGFSNIRSYQIERDGEVLCEAVSSWALINITEKKLLLAGDEFKNYYSEEALKLPNPMKFRISPELKMSLVGDYTVKYSDTDINGHMSNTAYPDMLFNCFNNPDSKRIKSIALSFANEARTGDYLKIYMAQLDGKYYLRSLHEDGRVNVEAEIIIDNLD